MKKFGVMAALLGGTALMAACGQADDGSPTAAENEQLNKISEELDTSADSLVVEEPALGNGEQPAATGDLPVDDGAANGAQGNGQ